MKLVARIPEDKIEDDVRYLIIESDENDSKGFFLFCHKSLDLPCDADLWFADIEGAKRQATFNYDVQSEDWHVMEV